MNFNHDTQNCDFWRSYVLFWKLASSWEGSHFILVRDFFLECNYYRSERVSKTKNTFHLPSWEPVHIPSQKHFFWVDDSPNFPKVGPMDSFPGENWLQGSRVIPGTPKDMGPPYGKLDPYHSHIFRDCYGNGMGPAYHFRGSHVLGGSLKIPLKGSS